MMWDFLFNSLVGWVGMTVIVVAASVAVAWFVPPLRNIALSVAGLAIAATSLIAKGNRDRARLEARRKEEAVKRTREAYDAIDKRPDTHDDVAKRLRDGGF